MEWNEQYIYGRAYLCWKERALSDSVIFEKDVAIPMRDGAVLRANVYRPNTSERFPVILTVGPLWQGPPF
jgi:predicted acyl esterase